MTTTSPYHQAAREWAQSGFAVFPCLPGMKEPATENGFKDATTDLEKIDAWWAENPGYNVGCRVDYSGHAVIDTDPPLGEKSLATLEREHAPLPPTFTIRSPRGGLHRWFVGVVPSSNSKIGENIDIKSRGGYVLLPPSRTPAGSYSILDDSEPVPLPAWVATIAGRERDHAKAPQLDLDQPQNISRARKLLQDYVASGLVAVEGNGGDNRTYQVAAEVQNMGVSEQAALRLMLEEWNNHCVPPWDEDELAVKVANAAEYAQNDAGAWGLAPAAEVFAGAVAALGTDTDKRITDRYTPRGINEQNNRPEPRWLLPGLIEADTIAVMYGASGSFKTFLALDLALVLASGSAAYDAPARDPMTVVYVAAEGAADLERSRRPAWNLARQIEGPATFYTVDAMPPMQDPVEVDRFVQALKAANVQPGFIVLDTLARSMLGMNENDSRDVGIWVHACEELRRTLGCSILAVHHTGKDSERGARGSSAIPANVDTMLEIERIGKTEIVQLRVKKQKNAREREDPFTFAMRPVGNSIVPFETSAHELHARMQQLDECSPANVAHALREIGAIGADLGVPTAVVASHLSKQLHSEKQIGISRDQSKTVRRLNDAAKPGGPLEAYCSNSARGLRLWFLPVETDDAAGAEF